MLLTYCAPKKYWPSMRRDAQLSVGVVVGGVDRVEETLPLALATHEPARSRRIVSGLPTALPAVATSAAALDVRG